MNAGKAPLNLIEQLIMTFLFALAAALCLQAFVHCHQESVSLRAQQNALSMSSSIADAVKANDKDALKQYGIDFKPLTDIDQALLPNDQILSIAYTDINQYAYTALITIYDPSGEVILSLPVSDQIGDEFAS